ncbi:MAG TPA: hypothetical protein PK264_06980, partial [Hyphomicrobiaceae bacterium]|nr:hypothetical protein [Hyphomicrobiaceae bacterium]
MRELQLGTLLFDTSGQPWDSESPILRQRWGGIHAGGDFTDFILRNIGFAEVRGIGDDGVELRFRPTRASELALVAAGSWISDRPFRRFAMTTYNGTWHPR